MKLCPLPWVNLSTDVNGSLRPCCKYAQPNDNQSHPLPNMQDMTIKQAWNSDQFKALRQAFMNGEQPRDCQTCWDEENAGIRSYRETFLENRSPGLVVDYTSDIAPNPQFLDLKLNNVCNLKCRICGPQASSTFLKEHLQFCGSLKGSEYWLTDKIVDTPNESILNSWADKLIQVEMTGGEPMTSSENLKILSMLSTIQNAQNITLLLNTNTTFYNPRVIDYFKAFKQTQLFLSIDDIGERIEYQRYPCDWSLLEANIQKYQQLSLEFSNIKPILFCTVSNFNVFYLNEYLAWAKTYNLPIYWNILSNDDCFSIKNLPHHVKTILREKLTDPTFNNIRNYLDLEFNRYSFETFLIRVNTFDNYRKQSFQKVFPEWANLLNQF
jgi:organic radical activating enzyme